MGHCGHGVLVANILILTDSVISGESLDPTLAAAIRVSNVIKYLLDSSRFRNSGSNLFSQTTNIYREIMIFFITLHSLLSILKHLLINHDGNTRLVCKCGGLLLEVLAPEVGVPQCCIDSRVSPAVSLPIFNVGLIAEILASVDILSAFLINIDVISLDLSEAHVMESPHGLRLFDKLVGNISILVTEDITEGIIDCLVTGFVNQVNPLLIESHTEFGPSGSHGIVGVPHVLVLNTFAIINLNQSTLIELQEVLGFGVFFRLNGFLNIKLFFKFFSGSNLEFSFASVDPLCETIHSDCHTVKRC